MSDSEKIHELNRKLHDLERRAATNWERPILEVARQAILQEISTLGRRFARWDQMIPCPVVGRRR